MKTCAWIGCVCWLVAATCFAADDFETAKLKNWHQFRGPLASGVAPEGNPPTKWDENTNIKWKLKIPGDSTATPIIWNDDLFTVTAIKTERTGTPELQPAHERTEGENSRMKSMSIKPTTNYHQFKVMCVDRNTGKSKWEQMSKEEVPHEGLHPDGSYAPASPITDGENVYVSFGSRGIYSYTLDGKQNWKLDLGKMTVFSSFGESTSPVLHKGVLVILWDHEEGSYILAVDAKTGSTIWKQERDEKTSWSTPLIVDYKGQSQVITYNKNFIRSYDLKTGDLLWKCHGKYTACIPQPLTDGELVFVMTGYMGYELLAIPLSVKGDITDDASKIAWEKTQGTPYVPSAMLYGENLWFTQQNNAILTVLNAKTGDEIIARKRLDELKNIYASPVGAANRVYITSREGVTQVLKNANEVEVLATNKLDDRVDASAAIAGNQLFIRGRETLYCIQE